jgi:AraC-like DNA-binding protein
MVMATMISPAGPGRLERSCGPSSGDWIRFAPSCPGLERIEALFGGYAFDPHRHDTYAIGYTLNGVQSFDYRGARRDSTTGQVIVLHPDEVHDGRAGASGGFRYRLIYIEPRLIRNALGRRTSALPFVRSPVVNDARLLNALQSVLDDMDRVVDELEADRAVLDIADALCALDPSIAHKSLSPACAAAVERGRLFLDAHYCRVVASAELESVTGVDRYTLARHFRAMLGTSPYRYLTLRRLDKARSMMREGRSLASSAIACGFADQSHMTRQFKQAYGLSPSRWRAIWQGAAPVVPGSPW